MLTAAGLADLFDARIDGLRAADDGLAGAPAPDMFLAAARVLEVDPEEAVVFDGAAAGIAAGRAGHFGYVVGVDRAARGAELRARGADAVVSDLAALLG
jgi:HAD superfamily hydrolase (TIGR01509 family)